MKLHEYQARELLAQAGVPVPAAVVVDTAEQAAAAFTQLNAPLAVVKAQVHAGGRGKGGGVKLVRSADEARAAAAAILSKPLITPQTGPEGVPVHRLLVASGVDIAKEFYVAITVDRASAGPVVIASREGGMDIEHVAATNPQAILRLAIDPALGMQGYQARQLAFALGLEGEAFKQAVKVFTALCSLFMKLDASLVEVNPLVLTKAGQVLAIDAKITTDDNASFRHADLAALFDERDAEPSELAAQKHNLSYIKLEGTIGCLVNGAGLAMATMDMIKLHGGEPANFLDVGGSATQQAVTEAFRIILADESVKGILVNIFGGIAKCDVIANAIVGAAKEVGFTVPLVVRLEGTHVEQARVILDQARPSIPTLVTATDLTDAAAKITQVAAA